MYKGLGNQLVEAEDYLLNIGLTEFAFNPNQEGEKASQEFRASNLVNAEEFPGTTTYRFTLSYNRLTWQRQGFHLNQRSRSREVLIPTAVVNGTVPATAPYTVTDPLITADADAAKPLKITLPSFGTLERVTGTPEPGEFAVNLTTGVITFNAAQAGANYVYPRYGLVTANTYGGPTGTQEIGEFEYWGEIYIPNLGPSGEWFHVPKARILTIPAFTVNNSVPTVAVECSMILPDGWDVPWEIIDSNSAVPVVA